MLRMHQPKNIIDIVSAIIPVLLLNADVWFMFIPKKIFVLTQAPFVAPKNGIALTRSELLLNEISIT